MGYLYKNGSLVCEVCGKTHAIKRHCPFDWCSPVAICKECWQREDIRNIMSADKHRLCHQEKVKFDARMEKERELYKQGRWVRWSASYSDPKVHGEELVSSGLDIIVHFKDSEFMEQGIPRTFLMSKSTYHAFDLLYPATIEEFANVGKIVEIVFDKMKTEWVTK